jgi:hypothetical protein
MQAQRLPQQELEMTDREINALRTDIGRMSTRALNTALNDLYNRQTAFTDELENDRWTQIDLITDELAGRAHDLEDPSSGLSLHQPS